MRKKITALLICMSLLGVFAPAAGVSAASVNTGDKLETLQGLGLWAGSVANLDTAVTRANFIEMADRLYGIPVEETDLLYFRDVPKGHPSHAAISAAAARGIVNGDGENFEPDREITAHEVLKIMLSAQGYAPYAAEKGGYPSGYLKCAAEIGLTAGIQQSGVVTYEDMIGLFYNALDTDAMVPEALGDEKVSYAYVNMLEEFHDICKKTGQVTATYDSTLYSESNLSKERVQIDEEEYDAPYQLVSGFLGVRVNAYYRKYSDRNSEVVYMCTAPGVRFLTVKSEDMEEFQDFRLRYYDANGREQTAALSSTAAVIYNGQAICDPEDFTPEILNPKNGTVTLIDNGWGYEVAKIMDYETVVISGVSQNLERFYDKYTGKAVELGTNDKISMVDKQGNEIPLQALSEYDVASVAVSKGNNRTIRIVISADAVEGRITKVTSDSPESCEIQISRERFKLTEHFAAYLREQGKELEAGESGVFYLDYLGAVAAYESGERSGARYAYLIKTREVSFGGAEVRIMDQDGKIREMALASRVKIGEGAAPVSAAAAYQQLTALTGAQRLMRIELNSDGELAKVIPPVAEGMDGEIMQTYDAETGNLRYKDVSQCFGGKFNVDDSTLIFSVPSAATEGAARDEDYEIKSFKQFANDTNYTVSAFITEKDVLVQDIVISYEDVSGDTTGHIQNDARMGIVKEIVTELDDEGYPVKSLSVFLDGREQKYQVEEEEKLTNIHPGDGVRVAVNTKGALREIEKLFDYETRSVIGGANKVNGYDNLNYIFYGKVLRKDGNIIQVEGVTEAGTTEKVNILVRGNIYHIEDYNGRFTVQAGTATDILDKKVLGDEASNVLIQSRYSDTKVVAIYD